MKTSLLCVALSASLIGAASARTVSITGMNRENGIPDVRTAKFFTGEGLIFARGIPGLCVIVK